MTTSYAPGTTGIGPFANPDTYAAAKGWPASNTGSGSGFGGAFSKNFGKSFLDMWSKRNFGGGGGEGDQNVFNPGSMGGGSISPIGSSKHHLFQYQPAQAQVIQNAPSGPGFGEQLAQTAVSAGLSAAIGGLCDIRTKVDIAPLESTEVNDSLAEIAFFVKGLRECA
jgi:hypothetical protein